MLVNSQTSGSVYAYVYAANLTTSYSNVVNNNNVSIMQKIESITIINFGGSPASASILFTSNTRGLLPNTNTSLILAGNVTVLANNRVVLSNRDMPIVLQEYERLEAMANTSTCVMMVNALVCGV
ncbi:MAG: hypothetical protein EBU90_17295 [Proteobacteria bacterium]|nr:hypothetical protein [Pseudomonadota bacterium]NBP15537.1 hypothetical protein [bacterium]